MRVEFQVGTERIAVNMPDMASLAAAVSRRLSDGQGFALATLNLDHLVKLRESAAFRAAYRAQDFVTADGNPVVWLARAAGQRVALLPGSDLIVPLCQIAVATNAPVGLVGSTDASLEKAASALQMLVPGLVIAARISPPMGFDPEGDHAAAVLDSLEAAGVRLCLLALGAPKQECLAARGRSLTPQIGYVCIGAGLDFLSGHQRRAPAWVRAIAMEWMWRMLSDPRRLLVRYAKCALVLPGHLWRSVATRAQGG